MKNSFPYFIIACFAAISLLATGGCVKSVTVGTVNDKPPLVTKGGPPPHAPAHGYRAKYQYRYYPDCRVYYDTGRALYFYLDTGVWKVSVTMPKEIEVTLESYVTIETDTDKPYIYNDEHVKKYPPGQAKDKTKKKNR